jgi:poly(hydroxyalkanoate) depolymerase family esterase
VRRSGRAIRGGLALVALALALAGAAPGDRAGQFTRGRFDDRAYRLYVPAAYAVPPGTLPDAALPAPPLVLALHGCWQTPEDFARGTRLNEAAERRGLLVLYPAQTPHDNVSRCWNWFAPAQRDRGEAGALLALVRQVATEHGVDRKRIVVVGFSAGAFMAVNLACIAPDVVSGVAVAAGGPFRCGMGLVGGVECMRGLHVDGEAAATACRNAMGARARPMPATLWHGADDTVVNPVNLEALAAMFARLAGAAASATERRPDVVYTAYRDARGRVVVESWLVRGMTHAWSGGDARATHTFPPGPNATERILDFLLGEPRTTRGPEVRHGSAGARPSVGGLGAVSGPPWD